MSAGTGDRAEAASKPANRSTLHLCASATGAGSGWRRPEGRATGLAAPAGRDPQRRAAGLVALAAVMALVDQPPQPGADRRLPGIFQYLPPPVRIAATPPVVDQPLPAAEPAPPPAKRGPSSVDRGHPRRATAVPSPPCRGPGPGVGLGPAGPGSGRVGRDPAAGRATAGGHAAGGGDPGGPGPGAVGVGPGQAAGRRWPRAARGPGADARGGGGPARRLTALP